jgi:phosphate-selective porin
MKRSACALALAILAPALAVAQDPDTDLDALKKQLDELSEEVERLKAADPERPIDADPPEEDATSWTDEVKLGLFYVESVDKAFKLAIKGRLMVDGRYVINRSDFDNHFQLRRARIEFIGHLYERVRFSLGIELGRTSDADLRNAYVDIEFFDGLSLLAGQMLLPFSDLRLRSSKYLNHPERSMFVANIVGSRDIGAALHGTLGDVFDYEVGIFGGTGQNKKLDNDDDVDAAARIVIRPWGIFTPKRTGATGPADVLTVGNQFTTFLDYGTNDADGDRYRVGGGLLFSSGPIELTAEANVDYHTRVRSTTGFESDLFSWSWHAGVMWVVTGEVLKQKADGPKVTPAAPFYDPASEKLGLGAFAVAARYEEFFADDNVLNRGYATGTDEARALTGTAHWYLWESVRFSVSYIYTDFKDSIVDSQGRSHHNDHAVLGRLAFYF